MFWNALLYSIRRNYGVLMKKSSRFSAKPFLKRVMITLLALSSITNISPQGWQSLGKRRSWNWLSLLEIPHFFSFSLKHTKRSELVNLYLTLKAFWPLPWNKTRYNNAGECYSQCRAFNNDNHVVNVWTLDCCMSGLNYKTFHTNEENEEHTNEEMLSLKKCSFVTASPTEIR